MDITIDVDDYKLNVRAGGIIIHNNKLLVHRDIREDHYALIGGRVMIGENSEDTIKREILEEMGKEVGITGYVSTIENFFKLDGKKCHEIMFVHQLEFKNEEDKKIQTNTIKNIEGKDYLKYEWLDLDELNKYPLKPDAIKNILKNGNFPIHTINNDL